MTTLFRKKLLHWERKFCILDIYFQIMYNILTLYSFYGTLKKIIKKERDIDEKKYS